MESSSRIGMAGQGSGSREGAALVRGMARVSGPAAVLRTLAGTPAGHRALARERAGSFLVLVVGTLALLAVITIVYVALGNQDARTRSAVSKREQLDDVPKKMGDYVADVIARDAFALTYTGEQIPNPSAAGTIDGFRRETSDIPGVQWNAFSPRTTAEVPAAGEFRFDHVGGLNADATTGVVATPPVAVEGLDPWLAPHRPVDLNWNNSSPLNEAGYKKNLDWMSITNIAPDGAFVNLFNLRQLGLDATSSQLRGSGASTFGLSLLDASGQVTTDLDYSGAPADPNRPAHWTNRQLRAYRPAQPAATPNALFGEDPGEENYKLYQWVDADGDGMLDSRIFELADLANTGVQLPSFGGKYRYFLGARIVDLSGLINVNFAGDQVAPPSAVVGTATPTTQVPLGITPADIDLRRVLTMVDVYANNDILPAGGQSGSTTVTDQFGYNAIHQPVGAGDPGNYAFYSEEQAYFTGTAAYLSLRLALASGEVPPLTDYIASDGYPSLTQGASVEYSATFNPPASFTETMQDFAERQSVVPAGTWPVVPSRWKFSSWPLNSTPPVTTPAQVFSMPAQRARFYNDQAIRLFQSSTDFDPASNTLGTRFSGRFGMGDLAELLTRRATNDPSVTTALERALAGRDATAGVDTLRYSPLRSNRGEDVERRRYDTVDASAANVANRDRTLLQLDSDVRSLLTPMSWSRQLRSMVAIPTTTSAAQQVEASELSDSERKLDLRGILDQDVRDAAGNPIASDSGRIAAGLFRGYADALAPYSYLPESWQPEGASSTNAAFLNYRTLFYGYSGADVAVMAAAHMAVNMADMGDGVAKYDTTVTPAVFTGGYDDELTPTVRTLLLSGDTSAGGIRNTLQTAAVTDPIRQTSFPSWVPPTTPGTQGENLSLPNARLAPAVAPAPNSPVVPAIEVYGIEPQAFISQVATYTVYGNMNPETSPNPVEIDTSVAAVASSSALGSREVLYRMVAFKLVNPFDKDVVLSKDPYTDVDPTLDAGTVATSNASSLDVRSFPGRLDTAKDFQYIRFGDRSYMMMALDQEVDASGNYIATPSPEFPTTTIRGITLRANSTAIVYALSEPPSRILDTLRNLPGSNVLSSTPADYGAGSFAAGNLKETIKRALLRTMGYEGEPTTGTGTASDDRIATYWVPMIAGTQVGGVTETAGFFGDGTTQFSDGTTEPIENVQNLGNFVDVFPSAASLGVAANPTASLWRAIRQVGAGAPEQATTAVPAGVTATNAVAYAPNDYTNDMLVDRFRLPGETSQVLNDVTTGAGSTITVAGSDAGVNTALAITAVYRASRPLDLGATPGSTLSKPPVGVLPAYCFEAKYFGFGTGAWNVVETDLPGGASAGPSYDDLGSYSDASTGYDWLYNGVDGWARWVAIASKSNFGQPSAVSYTKDAVLESDPRVSAAATMTGIPSGTVTACIDNPGFNANIMLNTAGGPNTSNVPTVGGFTLDQMYPSVTIASPKFRSGDLDPTVTTPASVQSISILRLADALLPLGVGPQRAPLNPDGSPRPPANSFTTPNYDAINHQYTTLGEALAIAMGYESFAFTLDPAAWDNDPALRFGPTKDVSGTVVLNLPAVTAAGQDPTRVLLFDRGQLALDRFVPFLDNDNTGAGNALVYNPPATYGSLATTDDQRWGLQIPAAQAVLEQFYVPVAGREPGQERLRETLTRGTPGLININTAPVEVLRTLPLMSSRPFQWSNGGSLDWRPPFVATSSAYAADPLTWSASVGPNWMTSLNQAWDIPSGIVAYRDQRPVVAPPSVRDFAVERATSTTPNGLGASTSYPTVIDAATFAINSADPALGGAGVIGREAATGIPAIGDEQGFPSVGALLSVRNPLTADANVPTVGADNRLTRRYAPSRGMSLAIDAMGSDDPVGSATGVNNTDPRLDPYAGTDNGTAGAGTFANPYRPVNEYREKLQLANGSLNLITNRSDLFAAYFVVMGFSNDDIQAVREAEAAIPPRPQALVPSVQRRFLMVLDRSNVVRVGDKPKVLLFKEVPM